MRACHVCSQRVTLRASHDATLPRRVASSRAHPPQQHPPSQPVAATRRTALCWTVWSLTAAGPSLRCLDARAVDSAGEQTLAHESHSDEKVANREIRVWHLVIEKGN